MHRNLASISVTHSFSIISVNIAIINICSDVTIIESEMEIKFFLENLIESKSIFWLVFVIDFDSRLYWRRQHTAASSKNDS